MEECKIMYKAVFIDIDGTLRDDKQNISEKTKEMIKRVTQEGILVILCSGRPRKYTEELSRECFASKYIITSGGSSVYDYEKDEVLYLNQMNKQACIKLYYIAEKAKVRFIMNVGENRVVNQLKYFDGTELELKTDIETFVRENEVLQCVISDSDFNKIKAIKGEIEKVEGVEIKNQSKNLMTETKIERKDGYCDVANRETSKGNGIEKLCQILQIDVKDTIGIGDDFNDIAMFQTVGYAVVMGNANDKVKQYADEVTKSNEEEGVAVFLEKLLKQIKEKKDEIKRTNPKL